MECIEQDIGSNFFVIQTVISVMDGDAWNYNFLAATFMVSSMGDMIVGDTFYMTGGSGTIRLHD